MPIDVRSCPGILTIVEAHRAGTEMHDLQEATDNDEVFKEVDHLVLVGEVAMEEHCSRDNKGSKDQRYQTGSITEKQ